MIANTITFTNNSGDSVTFAQNSHFRLVNGFNLSDLTATVNKSSSTKSGDIYQSTKLNSRDFDIEFLIYRGYEDFKWIEDKRHDLFRVFNPLKNPFRIDFTTKGGNEYFIEAELISSPSFPQGFTNENMVWQMGLLQFNASDPFVYRKDATKTDIALWIKSLTFPVIFDGPITFGYRAPSLIVNVINEGSEDTGMIVRFKAKSEVRNPKLLNINTYEELKLNFTMQASDEIEISTYSGKRSVKLMRNGEVLNIFGTVDLTSTFLQLHVGDNLIRYDSDSGLDFLEVSLTHRNTLIGV